MNVRPILFSAPMVRALLAGIKTQTRRVVKPQPVNHDFGPGGILPALTGKLVRNGMNAVGCDVARDAMHYVNCAYGAPGDLLWVRETWAHGGWNAETRDAEALYRADAPFDSVPWKPSIHMPRWASRLTLRITDVRVQRLQDISDDDCVAEGVDGPMAAELLRKSPVKAGHAEYVTYAALWESINGAESWAANPWVWAISFDVIKANVDQVIGGAA